MVFDARERAADAIDKYPPFPFVGMDGETYELPNVMLLETSVADRINKAMTAGDDQALMELLEQIAPDAAEAIGPMLIAVTSELIQEWVKVMPDEGKSHSPPSAQNREQRRSKPTSPRKAKTSGRSRSAK